MMLQKLHNIQTAERFANYEERKLKKNFKVEEQIRTLSYIIGCLIYYRYNGSNLKRDNQ